MQGAVVDGDVAAGVQGFADQGVVGPELSDGTACGKSTSGWEAGCGAGIYLCVRLGFVLLLFSLSLPFAFLTPLFKPISSSIRYKLFSLPFLPGSNQPARLRRQRARCRMRRLLLNNSRITLRHSALRQRSQIHDHRRVSRIPGTQRRTALQAVQST